MDCHFYTGEHLAIFPVCNTCLPFLFSTQAPYLLDNIVQHTNQENGRKNHPNQADIIQKS